MDVDIFDKAEKRGEFFQFKTIGDKIQGTYVDLFYSVDGYNNEQAVFVLKDKQGKLWNVAIKLTSKKCIEYMDNVRFGQIVGFSFDGEGEPKNFKGGNKVKFINPVADIRFVDKVWIMDQTEALKNVGLTLSEYQRNKKNPNSNQMDVLPREDDANQGQMELPFNSQNEVYEEPIPVTKSPNTDDVITSIRTLAMNKGLVPAGADGKTVDIIITAVTDLEFIPENYTKIIVKLSSMKGN